MRDSLWQTFKELGPYAPLFIAGDWWIDFSERIKLPDSASVAVAVPMSIVILLATFIPLAVAWIVGGVCVAIWQAAAWAIRRTPPGGQQT